MKHIVITGSTRGIGFGLAKEFLKLGHKVTVNGTSQNSIDKAREKLVKEFDPSQLNFYAADASSYNSHEELWENAVKMHGPVDIWINNAGIDQDRAFFCDINPENVKKLVDINITGLMYGTSLAIKKMEEQGHGFIYNMEGFGSNGHKMSKLTLYGTSKRAVNYFTNSILLELKDSPVKLGTIRPGMVLTDLLLEGIPEAPKDKAHTIKIFNILADKVETIAPFIVKNILKNNKSGKTISWLTNGKASWRFMTAFRRKGRLIPE